MNAVLLFFISLVVLELLSLVGLYFAYRWLEDKQNILIQLRRVVLTSKGLFSVRLKTGREAIEQLYSFVELVYQLFPWWLRMTLKGMRLILKINPRVS